VLLGDGVLLGVLLGVAEGVAEGLGVDDGVADGEAPTGANAPHHKPFLQFLATVTVVAPVAPAEFLRPVAAPIAPPLPAVV
jgi:hypothetical protein